VFVVEKKTSWESLIETPHVCPNAPGTNRGKPPDLRREEKVSKHDSQLQKIISRLGESAGKRMGEGLVKTANLMIGGGIRGRPNSQTGTARQQLDKKSGSKEEGSRSNSEHFASTGGG